MFKNRDEKIFFRKYNRLAFLAYLEKHEKKT